jgi:probable F420-dependent oxidoreductase
VGTLVLNNDLRHPVLVAREAATVDLLTDGRLELGLGAGHMRSEYDEAGLPYDGGATRVARLGEAVQIVKGLLRDGTPVTHVGDRYAVRQHAGWPTPVQQPGPPLLIGGAGRNLLALAAREADIVGFVGFSPRKGGTDADLSGFTSAGTAAQVEHVRTEAGARVHALEFNVLVQRVVVTRDRHDAAAETGASMRLPMSGEEVLDSPYILLGTEDEIAGALEERRRRFGFSYFVVFEQYLEALAPVVARLAGA